MLWPPSPRSCTLNNQQCPLCSRLICSEQHHSRLVTAYHSAAASTLYLHSCDSSHQPVCLQASTNRGLLRAVAEIAPSSIMMELLDAGHLPLHNPDHAGTGIWLRGKLARVDAVLIASGTVRSTPTSSLRWQKMLKQTATAFVPAATAFATATAQEQR